MTALVAKTVAQRLLGKEMDKRKDRKALSGKDPFFEYYEDDHGKVQKKEKPIPKEFSKHDGKCLANAKKWAYRLDLSLFNFCGIRFGWSSVFGIIPGAGDIIDFVLAYFLVYRTACKVEGGLPKAVQSQMLFYLFIDFVIGLVPFAGDLADAVFRANSKNVALLEEYLKKKYHLEGNDTNKPQPGHQSVDPSSRLESGTILKIDDREDAFRSSSKRPQHEAEQEPQPGVIRAAGAGGNAGGHKNKKRGWFGAGGAKRPPPGDVEMGADRA